MAEPINTETPIIENPIDTQPTDGATGPTGTGATGPTGNEDETIDLDKLEVETRKKNDEKIDLGDDVDPDDAKVITAVVEKQMAGTKKFLQDQQDRMDVDAFITEKPEFTKYKPAILKYLQHPKYAEIPIRFIAAGLASDSLLKLGAKKEREAQAKADATKNGGSTPRTPQGGTTDWSKAPKDVFEAKKREILQGGR